MGCDYYDTSFPVEDNEGNELDWVRQFVHISEEQQGLRCLCTFGLNSESITKAILRSLAYLGAAVVMIHHGTLKAKNRQLAYYSLPDDLPDWAKKGIDKLTVE